MATRQYVGARYVPTFASPVEWSSGRSFEALTIVTYLNNSYTSKKTVPTSVGNPADNPDYWANTGNYNAQVEEYREVVDTLSTWVTPQMYGAKGDGVTDDTEAIQNAIESGKFGKIYFPAGTYLISDTLTLYSLTEYCGDGIKISVIKMKDTISKPIFESYEYSTYVANEYPTVNNTTSIDSFKNTDVYGSSFTNIHDLSLNGGYLNESGVHSKTSGNCVNYIGCGLSINNVEIYNVYGIGLLIDKFYFNELWSSDTSYNIHKQGDINYLEVHHCGQEGIIQLGLQDPVFNDLRIYNCGFTGTSGYGYSKVACLVMDTAGGRGSSSFNNVHIHNFNADVYGIYAKGVIRYEFEWLMIEQGGYGIYSENNCYGTINKLDFHNIIYTCFEGSHKIAIGEIEVYDILENTVVFKNALQLVIGCGQIGDINASVAYGTVFDLTSSALNVNLTLLNIASIFSSSTSLTRCSINLVTNKVSNTLTSNNIKYSVINITDVTNTISFDTLPDFVYFNKLTYANSARVLYPNKITRTIVIDGSNTTDVQTFNINFPCNIGATINNLQAIVNSATSIDYIYLSDLSNNTLNINVKLRETSQNSLIVNILFM